MPIAVGLAAFALVLVVLAVFIVITSYNTVVALDRRADRAWANVDVALKQRWDELPNLVAAVRGQLGFERTVLDDVTRLRAAYSPAAPLPEQAATSLATTAAVRSLFAVVERYPELHSNENVMALQHEIDRLETVIAHRRELFNEQVYQYNATIGQVPAVFLRGSSGGNGASSSGSRRSSGCVPRSGSSPPDRGLAAAQAHVQDLAPGPSIGVSLRLPHSSHERA